MIEHKDDDPRLFHDLERLDDEQIDECELKADQNSPSRWVDEHRLPIELTPEIREKTELEHVTAKAAQCGHNGPPVESIPDVITAQHWLPSSEKDFFFSGVDPRSKLYHDIEKVIIKPTIVMDDPEKPKPVKIISSWWIHADIHGVMTPSIFHCDLIMGLSELATTIREDQDPFQPVRLYKEANNAYGVGYFDFRGSQYPFDLRVVVQFGTWQFTTDEGKLLNSSGFKFSIATLVLPTESDRDIYVGHDFGKMFDD